MYFQPVVDTAGHRIIGQECLVRDSSGGRNGFEIIQCARATGRLAQFDTHTTQLAIRAESAQQKDGSNKGPWFINFFPALVADSSEFIRMVMDSLLESCMVPGDFVFEMVDSDLTGDSARLRSIYHLLKSRGFGFSFDNAGVASNSFQMILDYRPDYVKIDRRLAWQAEQPFCGSIIRKIVELADRNGVIPVATGVERSRIVENLWLLGVQVMQGYLTGRPTPSISRTSATSDLINLTRALAPEFDPAPAFSDLHK